MHSVVQMEIGEKIAKEIASKYGYLPTQPKQLSLFVRSIHNFAHYLGSNKYYSDLLNKRIALLSLDCDILALKSERARVVAENFYSQIELAMLSKKKAVLDKKAVEEFKTHMDELSKEALEVQDRALRLMNDIKREYSHAP